MQPFGTILLLLLSSAALVLLGHVFRLLRWEQFIRIYEYPQRRSLLRAMAGGYAVNFLLPFHVGDFLRAALAGRKMKTGTGFAFATVIMDRFLDVWVVALLFGGFRLAGLGGAAVLGAARYYLVFALLLAAALVGLLLSRLMARQLLKPLGKLRRVAAQVSRGDLDTPIRADSRDEIGDTLRAFEKSRLELCRARQKREQDERSRKEMLAGIAHDLATPLTKIQGYAAGIQDGIADTPEKRQRYLQKILETTENMAKLNQTLFLFSKLDLDQVPFHWETVDLCSWMRDYVEKQREHWEQNGLHLTFSTALTAAPIRMDRDQFARVLENLLGNSWKYKTEKAGTLAIALKPQGKNQVRLELADDGPGVAPEQLDRIFESFYRTDRARSHVSAGSGLGLAVVRKITTTMKGTIRAEANQPHGLKICMTFPLEEDLNNGKNPDRGR